MGLEKREMEDVLWVVIIRRVRPPVRLRLLGHPRRTSLVSRVRVSDLSVASLHALEDLPCPDRTAG